MTEPPKDALDALRQAVAQVHEHACRDNGCRFEKPMGMGTNSGCHCFEYRPFIGAALANLYAAAKLVLAEAKGREGR